MPVNEIKQQQWNVTKNDLFFRNKSETHTDTLCLFIYYLFGAIIVIVAAFVVVVSFPSLLFANGVFGSIQRTFRFLWSNNSSSSSTCSTICHSVETYKFAPGGNIQLIVC